MKKTLLVCHYELIFLFLHFITIYPSETKLTKKQDWTAFKILVEHGSDEDADKEKRRIQDVAKIFSKHPEFINNFIGTRDPITIAIQNHDALFDLFLASESKKNNNNDDDQKNLSLPLIFTAAHYGNITALEKLKEKNPNSVLITEKSGHTSILHQILSANKDILELHVPNGKERQKEILATLLATDGIEKTLSVQDKAGRTPLHLMVALEFDEEFKNFITKYKKLFKNSNNPLNFKDHEDLTPIDYAFFFKESRFIIFH